MLNFHFKNSQFTVQKYLYQTIFAPLNYKWHAPRATCLPYTVLNLLQTSIVNLYTFVSFWVMSCHICVFCSPLDYMVNIGPLSKRWISPVWWRTITIWLSNSQHRWCLYLHGFTLVVFISSITCCIGNSPLGRHHTLPIHLLEGDHIRQCSV